METKNNSLIHTKNFKKITLEILGVFLILGIYELVSFCLNDPLFIPSLGDIFSRLFLMLENVDVHKAFGYSLLRTFIGLLSSFMLAFILGTLSGYFKEVRYLLNPVVGLMKLVPTPCLVFIIFLFFYNELNIGSIILTFIVIFPILYESFIAGHDNLSDSIKLSLRLEGYYRPKCFFNVILPSSRPFIMLGIVNSLALGVKVSIMSEILLGSSQVYGIGSLISSYRDLSDYTSMFAIIVIVIFVFMIFDLIVFLLKKLKIVGSN